MKIALLGKRKYGFVTGTCSIDVYREDLHEQWETCNAVVLSWPMSSVTAELLRALCMLQVHLKCGRISRKG